MFATIYKLQAIPGQEERLKTLSEAWVRERQPQVAGFVTSYVIQNIAREGEYLGVTIFDSQENYAKSASDPEQDRWYRQMRECLEKDPEWYDGPVISQS